MTASHRKPPAGPAPHHQDSPRANPPANRLPAFDLRTTEVARQDVFL